MLHTIMGVTDHYGWLIFLIVVAIIIGNIFRHRAAGVTGDRNARLTSSQGYARLITDVYAGLDAEPVALNLPAKHIAVGGQRIHTDYDSANDSFRYTRSYGR